MNIVLFDGFCNLCNKAVQFIIRRDNKAKFKFASLQSKTGQMLLEKFNLPAASNDTLVYITGNHCYVKSKAVFMIMRQLDGGWPLISLFRIIPHSLSDRVYDYIAGKRYRFFGRRESCMLPSDEVKARFPE